MKLFIIHSFAFHLIFLLQNTEGTSSNSLTNTPNPQNIQFTMIYNRGKHQILTFERVNQEKGGHFCKKSDLNNPSVIKIFCGWLITFTCIFYFFV